MLRNYFIIAWRNITRHKAFTAINVLGLAFGVCACIIIYLITSYDLGFDTFHPDKKRIYRIVGESRDADGQTRFLNSIITDVAGLQTDIPGFENKAAFYDYSAGVSIPNGNEEPKKFDNRIPDSHSTSTIITWPDYFSVFSYQWLAGGAASLHQPFKVVLTENRGKKYFGNVSPAAMIGRTVVYDDSLRVTVAGIVKEWKGNSDFGYTDFISISTATHSFLKSRIQSEDWTSLRPHSSMAFVKLAKGTTPETINKRFADFVKTHVKFDKPGNKLTMYLQPITSIHFTGAFHRGDDRDDFRKAYLPALYALMGVALFILVIAIVNFINLSTAQSAQRAKEVGVRKVLGSSRNNIRWQFLTETFVLTLFATVVAMLLAEPLLYFFRDFVADGVAIHFFSTSTLIFLGCIVLVTTLAAGFYPAKVLASWSPALSLKGQALNNRADKVTLRKALIVFQFAVSVIFIMAALTIGRQINFMKYADKGFNTDAIITITQRKNNADKIKLFAQNIKRISGIDKVILQDHSPMGFAQMGNTFIYRDKEEKIIQSMMEIGNDEYVPFYQMKIIAGRNMLRSDSVQELVVNETMTRAMGFSNPQDAIGKLLYMAGPVEKAYPVAGVIADFHQGSFHDAIQPAVIVNDPSFNHSVAIKLAATEKNTRAVNVILSALQSEWKKLFPELDFDRTFLNDSITRLYGQEEKTARLVSAAMYITIFISCMGLFGLAMFTAQKRTKEIGIRKVMGATITDIAAMLSKDFIKLVAIAILIASPVAWYFMNQWLQDFVYR
ncbi:MAG TPA: ABC transporter permease, partial [Chitinophagaceae bacterium]|nr:ABC transporter permease [Chitinophagaceae bacterium]